MGHRPVGQLVAAAWLDIAAVWGAEGLLVSAVRSRTHTCRYLVYQPSALCSAMHMLHGGLAARCGWWHLLLHRWEESMVVQTALPAATGPSE
jgi:hypothetical protein